MKQQLSEEELNRYGRHIILPEINIEGQLKLKQAKVLVVGAGGLGAPLLYYLAAAGVGNIGIVDFDIVDISNLQRQILYTTDDVGQLKVEVAKKRLSQLNPLIQITTYNTPLHPQNALEIINNYDIVADGTDNFPTRYLVNDACVILNKINVYASIFKFEGQVAVFNYLFSDGTRGANYRDIFPEPPPPNSVPNCAETGVLGILPGIIGSIQAAEVIKIITSVGQPLANQLFIFDVAHFISQTIKIKKTNIEIKKLINYQEFCGMNHSIQEISVRELYSLIRNEIDFQLIDVREDEEYSNDNLEGILIPLSTIEQNINRIDTDKKVIIHCRSGMRSAKAISILQNLYPFENLYNLKGGILEFRREIGNI